MKSSIWIIVTFLVGLLAGMMLPSSGSPQPTQPAAGMTKAATKESPTGLGLPGGAPVSLPDPFDCWQKLISNQPHGTAESREDLLKRMAKLDPERAWRTLSAPSGGLKTQDVRVLSQAWADKDAQKAAEFGLALKDPLLRQRILCNGHDALHVL